MLQRKLGPSYTAHSQAKSFPLINLHGALPRTEEGHRQPVFGEAAAPWFCTRLRCLQRAPAAPLPRRHAAPRSPAEQRCLAPGGSCQPKNTHTWQIATHCAASEGNPAHKQHFDRVCCFKLRSPVPSRAANCTCLTRKILANSGAD